MPNCQGAVAHLVKRVANDPKPKLSTSTRKNVKIIVKLAIESGSVDTAIDQWSQVQIKYLLAPSARLKQQDVFSENKKWKNLNFDEFNKKSVTFNNNNSFHKLLKLMLDVFNERKLEKGGKCKYRIFVKHMEYKNEFIHFLSLNTIDTAKKYADIHQKGHLISWHQMKMSNQWS